MEKKKRRAILMGALTGVGFGLGGFFALTSGFSLMGSVLFFLVPFAAGFAIALVVPPREAALPAALIAFLLASALLLATGFEGWVCVIMSAPLLILGLGGGVLLGDVFRRLAVDRSRNPARTTKTSLIILPLLVFGAGGLEMQWYGGPRTETFATHATVPVPLQEAWDSIIEVDRIDAPKPFLLRIGLPVPKYCVLEEGKIGGKRICYFDQGYIVEEIIEWNPPHNVKLSIVEADIPGRPWLGFKEAIWELREESGQTTMARTTTITSNLYPVWYWRPLEDWGVQSEHNYIFADLRRRLQEESE